LTQLSELQSIGKLDRSAFERAAGRVAVEGRLHFNLPAFGNVIAGGQSTPSAAIVGSQRVITFPLRWFDRSARIQPTALLGENLSDVRVFKVMGEVGTVLCAICHLPIIASQIPGGGSTTGTVLGQLAASDRICLCIVDSDKVCPASGVGGTARTVAAYKNKQTYPTIEVLETVGRDLENVLPNSFFLSRYGNAPMATLLGLLGEQDEDEVRAHVDIELGMTLRDVWGHPPTSNEGAFWRNKLNLILTIAGVPGPSLPCFTTSACSNPAGTPCACVIVQGNRANILNDFLALYEGGNRFTLSKMLDKSVRGEWLRLGSTIASWCCGDDRLRL
jgi:hypothetical protein